MITFGIPFYSGMEYLERTIRSVVGQTYDQWQAIVCDDRGPADAEELVRSFQDPRIQYVRNAHNLGMVGNWNRCLDLATTDLVTILHSDDELLPNYCGLMSRKAAEFPEVAALYCHARFIGPRSQHVFSLQDVVKGFLEPRQGPDTILRGERPVAALACGNYIICPTLCYRRSRLGDRRFSSAWRFVQDMEFTTRLLLDGESIVALREVAYAYRRHPENCTSKFTENLYRFEEERAFLDQLAERCQQRGWPQAARSARRRLMVRLHLLYRAAKDLTRLRPGAALRKIGLSTSI